MTIAVAGVVVVASAAFTFQDRGALPTIEQAPPAATAIAPQVSGPDAVTFRRPTNRAEEYTFYWERPEGPLKVALQAGHWKSAEAPDEQAGLRNNGTRGGGKAEWEVNLEIAQRTARLLQEKGYLVEILPTTIPPGYFADLFLSIHADGSSSQSVSGYRASPPRRDLTGRASDFADLLEESYGAVTGLRHYPTVTRRMQNYYAFNWRRYDHALHPMTVAAILETGFLTSPNDRRVIVETPDRAAQGIAQAVILFLETLPLEPRQVTLAPEPRQRRAR